MSGTRFPTRLITIPKNPFLYPILSFFPTLVSVDFLVFSAFVRLLKVIGMFSLSLDQFPMLVHLLWRAGVTNRLPSSFGSESHSHVAVSVHFHPFLSFSYLSYI